MMLNYNYKLQRKQHVEYFLTINIKSGGSILNPSCSYYINFVFSTVIQRQIPQLQRSNRYEGDPVFILWSNSTFVKTKEYLFSLKSPLYKKNLAFCWSQCCGEHYRPSHSSIQRTIWQNPRIFSETWKRQLHI